MTTPLANSRGVALLTTLLALVFMVVLTLDFGRVIRRQLTGASTSMSRIDLHERARSAVNLALAILAADHTSSTDDNVNEHWANGVWLNQQAATLYDDGTIDLALDDHSGRLQINALLTPQGEVDPEQRSRLLRLLGSEAIGLPSEEAEHLLDALKDWLDPDDETSGFGAENSWYHALPKPYDCRNGPMLSLDELSLIRGFTPKLLMGSDNHPGLIQFLTPYGRDGAVNINTASAAVLGSLGEGIDHATVEALLAYRSGANHDLSSPDWIKNVSGDLTIAKATVSSHYFGVRVKASLRNLTLVTRAMVYRPPAPDPHTRPLPPILISWGVD